MACDYFVLDGYMMCCRLQHALLLNCVTIVQLQDHSLHAVHHQHRLRETGFVTFVCHVTYSDNELVSLYAEQML